MQALNLDGDRLGHDLEDGDGDTKVQVLREDHTDIFSHEARDGIYVIMVEMA